MTERHTGKTERVQSDRRGHQLKLRHLMCSPNLNTSQICHKKKKIKLSSIKISKNSSAMNTGFDVTNKLT